MVNFALPEAMGGNLKPFLMYHGPQALRGGVRFRGFEVGKKFPEQERVTKNCAKQSTETETTMQLIWGAMIIFH